MSSLKRWIFDPVDEYEVQNLAQHVNISPVLARMLICRNIRSVEQAQRFLNPERSHVYDPFLMKNMDIVVKRIQNALANNEKVLVYGDYDVDGATSTAIMYLLLKELGANVDTYIPDRFTEGYGLNVPAIEKAVKNGYSLLITVDNGIAAINECKFAKDQGVDLIITDHHQPPAQLPEAYAILNPKQPGCEYPDKMLAGAGITWKLAHAILGTFPEQYVDLAALGTIADLAPLVDENRLIAYYGLQRMNHIKRAGIQALLEVSGIEDQSITITAGHIGFSLGPRINASGRLDSAMYALELLTTEHLDRARELAHFLNETNRERQELCEDIFEEAVQMIDLHPEWLDQHVLVVAGEEWNAGVIGIVASRLVERYYRPTIVLAIQEKEAKGSARSIDGFDLYEALHQCTDLFSHFGGHTMAAGLSLESTRIDVFRLRFAQIASDMWQEEWNRPKLMIDASLKLADASLDLLASITRMEPFGFGNPKPRFYFPLLQLHQVRAVGREGNHLQFRFSDSQLQISGIAFRMGASEPELLGVPRLDVVAELSLNDWNGKRNIQLIVNDWDQQVPSSFYTSSNNEVAATFETRSEYSAEEAVAIIDLRVQVMEAGMQYCLQDLAEKVHGSTIVIFHKGIFLYHQLVLQSIANELAGIWLVNGTGDMEPLVDNDDGNGTIFLLDYPLQLEQYRKSLKFLNPSMIYLMQGVEAQEIIRKQCDRWLPAREQFAAVYRLLQAGQPIAMQTLLMRWQEIEDPTIASRQALKLILQIFLELGFVVETDQEFRREANVTKKPLTESSTYRTRMKKVEDYQWSLNTFKEISAFREF